MFAVDVGIRSHSGFSAPARARAFARSKPSGTILFREGNQMVPPLEAGARAVCTSRRRCDAGTGRTDVYAERLFRPTLRGLEERSARKTPRPGGVCLAGHGARTRPIRRRSRVAPAPRNRARSEAPLQARRERWNFAPQSDDRISVRLRFEENGVPSTSYARITALPTHRFVGGA